MTRAEQIEEAANKIIDDLLPDDESELTILQMVRLTSKLMVAMAKWADAHPEEKNSDHYFSRWQSAERKLAVAVEALRECDNGNWACAREALAKIEELAK